MYRVNLFLERITTCSVVGKDIPYFVDKIQQSGLYVFIEDYYDGEEFDENDEVDVMIFKLKETK